MEIGERIKFFRKKACLTQVELAAKASISRSYLADVEKNRYNPSLDTLGKIVTALEISKSKFFSEELISLDKKDEHWAFARAITNSNSSADTYSHIIEPIRAYFTCDNVTLEDKEDLFSDLTKLYFKYIEFRRTKFKKTL